MAKSKIVIIKDESNSKSRGKSEKWGKSIKICNFMKKWSAKSLANALGFAFARFMKICVGYFGKKATPKFATHKRNIKKHKKPRQILILQNLQSNIYLWQNDFAWR